ncbi:MAG: SDR family oxidoreductase [Phycisphaerales bacterium]|nr:SDR family oxidoreductase [Phycisphaerales bacterium]
MKAIEGEGGRAIAVKCDVSDGAQCVDLVEKAFEAFGPLYSVYANAGYGLEKSFVQMSEAELRAIFETNLFGTTNLVRAGLKRMSADRTPGVGGVGGGGGGEPRGHVLICSSCLARQAIPYYGAYSATKAAQHHLGQAMRHELWPSGVAVTTVHPITTSTELFDKVKQLSGSQRLSHSSPGWLTQTPEFVAARTVACLRRPRPEVWPGFAGGMIRVAMSVASMWPGLGDFALRKMVQKRQGEGVVSGESRGAS